MRIDRRFILGDEWLYLKIYSGQNILDKLLQNEIWEMTANLYKCELIEKFFFVRYIDSTGYHLRLRFKIVNNNYLHEILLIINRLFKPHVTRRIISSIVFDTYVREIERYGAENICDVESIFSYDSWNILSSLNQIIQDDVFDRERYLWGIKGMDKILDSLGLSLEEKHLVCEKYYKMYDKEFSYQNDSKKILSLKHRDLNQKIVEKILMPCTSIIDSKYPGSDVQVSFKSILARFKKADAKDDFTDLVQNIMHMHYNRVFIGQPRLNEFVVYYMMSKIYKSLFIRKLV